MEYPNWQIEYIEFTASSIMLICQENANESKNDWNFDHKDGDMITKNGVNGF